jgi:hypothetical protein
MKSNFLFRRKSHLLEDDSNENPIPCTVVDVLVVDERGNPIPNVRIKISFRGEDIRTSNFKFIKTDSNGESNNIRIATDEGLYLVYGKSDEPSTQSSDVLSKKSKLEQLKKRFSVCNKKEKIEIKTIHKRNKKTFSQNVCINNAYLYNSNPDETFRFDTSPNSNKLKIVLSKPAPKPVPV